MPTSKRQSKAQPTWADVKAKLAGFDRAGLLGLIQNLYAANQDNQVFLHTRFELGEDVLEPYKKEIDRWISPDVYRNQRPSVSRGKQAISDYKKAGGSPERTAELMIFYCELASAFIADFGEDDSTYINSLLNTFEQALKIVQALPDNVRDAFIARLDHVRTVSHRFGYGIADVMDDLLAE